MKLLVECVCGASFEAEPELAGGTIDCSSCRRELRVPSQEWSDGYRAARTLMTQSHAPQRREGYVLLESLGGVSAVLPLYRGLEDPGHDVVNVCLRGLMKIAPEGHERILSMVKDGNLKVSRLVAMVREENFIEGVDTLCEWIDSGALTQAQIAETVPLLGSSGRKRALATLRALRRVYPNLQALVDDAVSNFKEMEDEKVEIIPEAARLVRSASLKRVQEMAESQRTLKRQGCFGVIAFVIAPSLAGAGTFVWYLLERLIEV